MKKMSWGKLSLVVLCVSLLLNSCSKGSDGAAGATGPAGPAGPAGPTGATGSANVIYSAWLDVAYTYSTTDSLYEATITAPKIVDSILQKGQVMAYINLNTTAAPAVFSLPYFDGGVIIQSYFTLGKINLWSNAGFVGTTTSGGSKVQQYRYVIIPGGIASGRAATIDWKNYAAVKEYLGIKD